MPQDVTIDLEEKIQPEGVGEHDRTSPQSSSASASLDNASAKRKPRTKILLGVAGVLLITAAAAAGAYFFAGCESTGDAQMGGCVNAISSRGAGCITTLYVEDAQYVKAGPPPPRMD